MRYLLLLLVSLSLCQCRIDEIVDFYIDHDHVEVVQPIVNECDTMVITEPEFITIYNEYFNGFPDTLKWYFHAGQGNDIEFNSLEHLLVTINGIYVNFDSLQIYEQGNSIAAILRGTNDKSQIENKIWTRDAIGQKAIFTTSIQGFLFGGALTYEEYLKVAQELPSVRYFNFRNTDWTQAQYEQIAELILGECKLGRNDANFMFNAHPISDALYCRFIERGWEIVRGQVANCNPQPIIKPVYLDRA